MRMLQRTGFEKAGSKDLYRSFSMIIFDISWDTLNVYNFIDFLRCHGLEIATFLRILPSIRILYL